MALFLPRAILVLSKSERFQSVAAPFARRGMTATVPPPRSTRLVASALWNMLFTSHPCRTCPDLSRWLWSVAVSRLTSVLMVLAAKVTETSYNRFQHLNLTLSSAVEMTSLLTLVGLTYLSSNLLSLSFLSGSFSAIAVRVIGVVFWKAWIINKPTEGLKIKKKTLMERMCISQISHQSFIYLHK